MDYWNSRTSAAGPTVVTTGPGTSVPTTTWGGPASSNWQHDPALTIAPSTPSAVIYDGKAVSLTEIVGLVKELEQQMKELQRVVAVLQPALEFHSEFKELRDLHNAYEKKLKEVKEITKVFEILKQE